jgi:hypothetical protein
MTPLEKLPAITALVRAHLTEEAEAGFPRLSRTPSSDVIRLLDCFGELTQPERQALIGSWARLGGVGFLPPPAVRDASIEFIEQDPALLRYREVANSPRFTMGLRYLDLRMRKAILGDKMSLEMMARTRSTLDFEPRDDTPVALVPDPDNIHPAKAPQLRQLISKAFRDLFATTIEKTPGGETAYKGTLDGTPLTVWVDFAARGLQLRYGVTIPDESRHIFCFRKAYEHLWPSGQGWDYVTEEKAEASIQLLCENITLLVRIRNGVAELCQ